MYHKSSNKRRIFYNVLQHTVERAISTLRFLALFVNCSNLGTFDFNTLNYK